MDAQSRNDLFVFGTKEADACREFNETPFVRDSLKHSKLMSFFSGNQEYCVTEFFRNGVGDVFQIEKLYYKQVEQKNINEINCLPRLHVKARLFRPGPKASRGYLELVRTEKFVTIYPGAISKKVRVLDIDSWMAKQKPENDYVCEKNEDGTTYEPWTLSMCLPDITSGDFFCCFCCLLLFFIST